MNIKSTRRTPPPCTTTQTHSHTLVLAHSHCNVSVCTRVTLYKLIVSQSAPPPQHNRLALDILINIRVPTHTHTRHTITRSTLARTKTSSLSLSHTVWYTPLVRSIRSWASDARTALKCPNSRNERTQLTRDSAYNTAHTDDAMHGPPAPARQEKPEYEADAHTRLVAAKCANQIRKKRTQTIPIYA